MRNSDGETDLEGKCMIGWNDKANRIGRCCCNCKYQRTISGHPWNQEPHNGPLSVIIGYGCTVPDMPHITFFDKQHGICEMHDYRLSDVK
jgi:hypothetical protein